MNFFSCPRCQEQISAEAPTCPFCGLKQPARYQSMMQQAQIAQPAKPNAEQPKPKPASRWLRTAVIIIAFLGLGVMQYVRQAETERQQMETYEQQAAAAQSVSAYPASEQIAQSMDAEQISEQILPGMTIEQIEALLGVTPGTTEIKQSPTHSGTAIWLVNNGCQAVMVIFEAGEVIERSWFAVDC
ncbi:MAG: hypothetical protein P9M14_01545 [Candidatus Alcyoniella australis]|nr:hypothetical protein [Candidatus Alcyoniella australis]